MLSYQRVISWTQLLAFVWLCWTLLPHCFLISASFHSGLMADSRLWSRYGRTRMKMAVLLYPINYSHKSYLSYPKKHSYSISQGESYPLLSDVIRLSQKNIVSISIHSFHICSDCWRESLNWKPWFSPWDIGFSGFIFPFNQSSEHMWKWWTIHFCLGFSMK